MRILKLQKGFVYGPIHSRRLGLSLGINLMPVGYKLCSFNCLYCHYGWTKVLTNGVNGYLNDLPRPEDVLEALENGEVDPKSFNYITFSGNGEPTLHPQFEAMVDLVRGWRDERAPQARTAILSNSSTAGSAPVRRAIERLDVKIMKLDCGNLQTFQGLNSPHRLVDYEKILDGLKQMDGIIIQSVLAKGRVDNTTDAEVDLWIEKLAGIAPREVQIYSIDRPPADQSLVKVDRDTLIEIARKTEGVLGIPVKVY